MTKRNLFGYLSFTIIATVMFTIAWGEVGKTDCTGFTWMWYHPLYLLAAEKKGE